MVWEANNYHRLEGTERGQNKEAIQNIAAARAI
jgi:hypothetical protein